MFPRSCKHLSVIGMWLQYHCRILLSHFITSTPMLGFYPFHIETWSPLLNHLRRWNNFLARVNWKSVLPLLGLVRLWRALWRHSRHLRPATQVHKGVKRLDQRSVNPRLSTLVSSAIHRLVKKQIGLIIVFIVIMGTGRNFSLSLLSSRAIPVGH